MSDFKTIARILGAIRFQQGMAGRGNIVCSVGIGSRGRVVILDLRRAGSDMYA